MNAENSLRPGVGRRLLNVVPAAQIQNAKREVIAITGTLPKTRSAAVRPATKLNAVIRDKVSFVGAY